MNQTYSGISLWYFGQEVRTSLTCPSSAVPAAGTLGMDAADAENPRSNLAAPELMVLFKIMHPLKKGPDALANLLAAEVPCLHGLMHQHIFWTLRVHRHWLVRTWKRHVSPYMMRWQV